MFVKNKNNTDYTDIVKDSYNIIFKEFGYTIRITDMWKLLLFVFHLSEFDIMRYEDCNNGELYSYLIDQQIKWQKGEDVDFDDVYEKLLEIGELSGKEKLIFNQGNIQEVLWSIYLVICSPGLKFN